MTLTRDDWRQALVGSGVKQPIAVDWCDAFAEEWQPERFSRGMDDILALLPQVLHECGLLTQFEENLSYSAQRLMAVWPSRFPTLESTYGFAGNPVALAEKVYGKRMGNTVVGWAHLYRGRGGLMFTGRDAYVFLSGLCGQDYDVMPELLLQKRFGLEACRRWWEHEVPDGFLSDIVKARRRVNGGAIGLDHCRELADSCRRAFA